MKCLALLTLVAVCRGLVIRDSVLEPFQEQRETQDRHQYPVEESLPGQTLQQSLFKTPITTGDELPLESAPEITPYNHYTKPQTFMDYIGTIKNGKPWSQGTTEHQDVLDFQTFTDLIQFPGGDFLQNEIDKCLWNILEDARLPMYWPNKDSRFPFNRNIDIDLTGVQGIRDVLPNIVTKLEKMVPLYMQTTNDPSTMAMLVTRDLIKIALHGRMKCPTTTWDKFFIENINDKLYKVANDQKDQLSESFRMLLQEVLTEITNIDQLVYTIAQDVQQHVYKDVIEYAHGVVFEDVAIVSHKLYRELKRVLEQSWYTDVSTFMESLVAVVSEIVTSYGTCPRKETLHSEYKQACWDFKKLFLERELPHVHSGAMNIIHHFLHRTCTGEDCMLIYPRMTAVVKTIVRRYISTVVQRVPMCQTPDCLDPWKCMTQVPVSRVPTLEAEF